MKRILVAALAAFALSVVVGPASASAGYETVLCETDSVICPESDIQPAGSWLTLAGGTATVNGWYGPVCGNFALASKTLAESGAPLLANGESGALNSCQVKNQSGSSCSVQAGQTNNKIHFFAETQHGVSVGSEPEPLIVSYVCTSKTGYVVECTYAATKNLWVSVKENEGGEWEGSGSVSMTKTAGNKNCLSSTATFEYTGVVGTGNYISQIKV